MKNFGIIILLIISLSTISTTVSASDLAVIKINNTETVTFLNHTSSKIDGNWIVLNGGTPVQIPRIIFEYNGKNISFKKNGKIINVTSPTSYKVQYPFLTHPMYANNSRVNATFNYSSDITGNIDVYLVKTYPTELTNIVSKMVDGNTTPFRNLLTKSVNKSLNVAVGSPINFSPLSAGDYVVIVMLNDSNQNNLTIASATTFQVLEYNLTATVPVHVKDFLKTQVNLKAPDANYTYGAFLVRKDVFDNFNLKLRNNGTKAGINLTLENEYLIDGFKIMGKGINNLNKNAIKNLTEGFLKSNKGSVLLFYGRNNTSISFTTDDLNPGDYILSIGVWSNKKDERLVGFIQKEVEVSHEQEDDDRHSGGSGGGGGAGGNTDEDYKNIKKHEIKYNHLIAHVPVKYQFTQDEAGIHEIILTGKENENDIALRVEYLNGLSSNLKEPAPGVIRYYSNILAGTKKIEEARINFRVENSWITDNDLSSSEIKLLKWDGSKWLQLDTMEKTKDEYYTYFESRSETFSHFAVSGIKNMPASTSLPEATINPGPQTTPANITPDKTPTTLNWIIYIITAMLIITAVYLYIIKKKG